MYEHLHNVEAYRSTYMEFFSLVDESFGAQNTLLFSKMNHDPIRVIFSAACRQQELMIVCAFAVFTKQYKEYEYSIVKTQNPYCTQYHSVSGRRSSRETCSAAVFQCTLKSLEQQWIQWRLSYETRVPCHWTVGSRCLQ